WPGPMISTWPLDELSPAVSVTSATVPAIGDTIVAAARFCCASANCAFAASTDAWSAAICSADAGPDDVPPDRPEPDEPEPEDDDRDDEPEPEEPECVVEDDEDEEDEPTSATTLFNAVESVATDDVSVCSSLSAWLSADSASLINVSQSLTDVD